MNCTIDLYYLTRLSGQLARGFAPSAQADGGDFGDMAARLRAERADAAPGVSEPADLEGYKRAIRAKISQLPMSASSQMQSISIQITDAGFQAMKDDPEYEAWVLDTLARDLRFENPWTSVCGGGYVIHHFGAAKEEYRGKSWYPGYMGSQGGALFDEKSEDSFWEQRIERHKKYMELQQEAAARRRLVQCGLLNSSGVSAAELFMLLL